MLKQKQELLSDNLLFLEVGANIRNKFNANSIK